MTDYTPGRGTVVAAQLLLLFAVAACGRTGTETGAPAGEQKAAAVENVEAMAREHADDTAEPSEAAQVAPARDVTAERLAYAEVDDEHDPRAESDDETGTVGRSFPGVLTWLPVPTSTRAASSRRFLIVPASIGCSAAARRCTSGRRAT